jgi:ureidoglycolate hydrolase
MIPETLLEVHSYTGAGFKPLILFNSWRVAIMNFMDNLHPDRIESLERHPETDEVFILLRGQGILVLAEGEPDLTELYFRVMEPGCLYNVKPACWHSVVMSRDASILIVENANTNEKNSQFIQLKPAYCRVIQETARREQPRYWD